jgi:hypothetical protein
LKTGPAITPGLNIASQTAEIRPDSAAWPDWCSAYDPFRANGMSFFLSLISLKTVPDHAPA